MNSPSTQPYSLAELSHLSSYQSYHLCSYTSLHLSLKVSINIWVSTHHFPFKNIPKSEKRIWKCSKLETDLPRESITTLVKIQIQTPNAHHIFFSLRYNMHISQFIHNKTATIIESQQARNKKKTVRELKLVVTTGMKHNKIQPSIKEITFKNN